MKCTTMHENYVLMNSQREMSRLAQQMELYKYACTDSELQVGWRMNEKQMD